jgi:hypothetical protein
MEQPARDREIEAVRRAVYRAGRMARRLACGLRWTLLGLVLGWGFLVVPFLVDTDLQHSTWSYFRGTSNYLRCRMPVVTARAEAARETRRAEVARETRRVVSVGVPAALIAVALVTALYCAARRRELWQLLAGLPSEARAAALLPLGRCSCPYTRRIAGPLRRHYRGPAEVAPAPAPAGRGDEARPAGEPLPRRRC